MLNIWAEFVKGKVYARVTARAMGRESFVKGAVRACVLLFVLLCSAQPFRLTSTLYHSKPEDVPAWAEQGNFRFIRLDGGQIESWKAQQTWWGKKFNAEDRAVLAHIYDSEFEQMLGLLKDAEFDWIWVTWSNGWSFREEEQNRENLRKIIDLCHKNGIHVSAYMSASNMFTKSTYRDDPETKRYGLRMDGLPMFYAGPSKRDLEISWGRRLADTRNAGWRAYLMKKAALAIDAGVDAIVWDNMIGYDNGLAQLLDDTQRMAECKARENGRAKVMVYANVHIAPGRFALNDMNDLIWEEDGKDTPGVWDGNWQVDNARRIKFLRGEKQSWQPLLYENDRYHCGARERCIPGPSEQKLLIAEDYAFGAATSRNIEGRFLSALIRGESQALDAWSAIAQYNHFVAQHRELYHDAEPVARIALLSSGQQNWLADKFLKTSLLFETKVLSHLDKGVPLDHFKVLVLPANLPKLNAEQNSRLEKFVVAGGVIIRAKKGEPGIARRAELAAEGPCLRLEPRGYVLGQLTRESAGRKVMLHLLNYDYQRPARNVKVRLDLRGVIPDLTRWKLSVLSPDTPAPQSTALSLSGHTVEFTLTKGTRP